MRFPRAYLSEAPLVLNCMAARLSSSDIVYPNSITALNTSLLETLANLSTDAESEKKVCNTSLMACTHTQSELYLYLAVSDSKNFWFSSFYVMSSFFAPFS